MPESRRVPPEKRLVAGRLHDFLVMNRAAAERYTLERAHVLISISSPRQEIAAVPDQPSRLGLLRVVFDDVGMEVEGLPVDTWWSPDEPPPILFVEEHGKIIRRFVEQHRDRARIIAVHCQAGLSRSPAVAMALADWLEGDGAVAAALARWVTVERLGLDPETTPWNLRVQRVLSRVLGTA